MRNTIRRTVAVAALLLCGNLSHGQALRSSGEVPQDLKMSVQQLYDTDIKRAEKYAGGRVRDKQSLLEASYRINKMMAGGHIVYGDPISRMVQRVADTLLKDYPALRSELRFYVVTSSDVNAFTTPQGMVFINAGLVAQVENEAQLAFIISHEIVHYYKSHGLESLVGKNGKKKRADNLDDEAESAGDFLRYHSRSREMENEADSLGIAMFYLKSPYSKDITEGVFDVLQYSELPFDDIPFDTTWFNTPYYKLTGCWLDTIADITSRDNYDDSHSTHPNILSRRKLTAQLMAGRDGGSDYVVTTREEFEELRHMARLECIRQDLINGNYYRAFYNSWVLEGEAQDDVTLNHYLAQALYGVAVFKSAGRDGTKIGDYKKIEGESQQVYYALSTMSVEQNILVALRQVWHLHTLVPDNDTYTKMAYHLMDLLKSSAEKSATDFLDVPPKEETAQTEADTTTVEPEKKPLSKYERIKQKRQTQTLRKPTSYSLTDIMMADNDFTQALHQHLDGIKSKKNSDENKKDTSAMLVFNPSYWVINSDDDMKVKESDSREDDLLRRIIKTNERFGRKTVDFSDQGMHMMTDAQQYNEFLTVCEWMNEFWLTKGEFEMCRLTQPDMNSLLDKYGARTMTMTAMLNKEGLDNDVSLGYAIIVPLAPLVVVARFSNIEHTTMVSLVVDARDGKMLTRQVYNYNVADHSGLVDAMLYDTYIRSIRKSKKDPVGHMGHRFAVAGGVNAGLSGAQSLKAGHTIALTPWASVEMALTRNKSLAFTARYQKYYEDVTQTYTVWPNNYTYKDVTEISSRNMLTLGFDFRLYKYSDFAPLGLYFDAGAHMVHFTKPDGSSDGNSYGFHLGFGRNYIVASRLLFNFQIDYAYTYGIHYMKFGSDYYDDPEDRAKKHYPDAALSNAITIKLGLGFIPF